MMRKVVLFILLIVVTSNAYAQFLCDDDKGIRDFIIKVESGDNGAPAGDKCSLFAIELLNPETKLDTKWGIFRIGGFMDHSYTHFLLIKDGKRTYLNTHGYSARALQAIVEFLDSSDCTEEEKLLYLKKAINVCYRNSYSNPWAE